MFMSLSGTGIFHAQPQYSAPADVHILIFRD
jgi:hypothetical protein